MFDRLVLSVPYIAVAKTHDDNYLIASNDGERDTVEVFATQDGAWDENIAVADELTALQSMTYRLWELLGYIGSKHHAYRLRIELVNQQENEGEDEGGDDE